MNLILLGPPGAGKGTLASRLIKKYNIPHISTGDIFRENIKNETELGLEVKGYMARGELVPDELVVRIALDRLNKEDCNEGFMLDGFPRTVFQAEELDKFLKEKNDKINFTLNLSVSDEILKERLINRRICKSCGATYNLKKDYMKPKVEGKCDSCNGELYQREDDKAETVENRISVYNEQTAPLISYYNNIGNLVELDSSLEADNLFKEVCKILGE